MKKVFTIVLVVCLLVWSSPAEGQAAEDLPQEPDLEAEAALLMEAQSGQVLYSKNPDRTMYPASITKILTGIIAIESGKLEDVVTVSSNAVNAEGTSVYLEEGEQKKLLTLVYGMLVNSGNDAAVAIAEYLGGSVSEFADMMNDKARELGARHSHFMNPSGLPDEEHVTTAHDMALITRYAMQNETFRNIVGTKEYPWEGEGWQPEHIINHNRLLWDYEGATGVKNGYTSAAQQTFVATSEREGQQLIAVTLKVPGSANVLYRDLMQLLDYGYDAFETHRLTVDDTLLKNIVISDQGTDAHLADERVFITLPKGTPLGDVEQNVQLDEEVSLPVKRGDELGHIHFTLHNDVIQKIPIYSMSTVQAEVQPTEVEPVEDKAQAGFPWMLWLFSFLVFSWSLLYIVKRRKQRREMRHRMRTYGSYRG